jgi:hypothetical protein
MAYAPAVTSIHPADANGTNRFPLAACAASILMTSLGLAASALDIQWGTAHNAHDALPQAWLYVGVMWMLTWLLAWPAISRARGSGGLFREWAGALIGAIPAAGLAALFSDATWPMIAAMIALQLGTGLLAAGLLAWAGYDQNTPVRTALVTGLLSMAGIVAPVLAFLQRDFFPGARDGWMQAIPLFVLQRAARHATDWSGVPAAIWWAAAIESCIGMTLLWFSAPTPPLPARPPQ